VSRRSKRARAYRDETPGSQASRQADDEQIVVHVHVHRDGARKEGAPKPARRRRPTLSGPLFDWKGHYKPVAKRHHESIADQPPEGWLTRVLRRFLGRRS
jgi:hypothetical protein